MPTAAVPSGFILCYYFFLNNNKKNGQTRGRPLPQNENNGMNSQNNLKTTDVLTNLQQAFVYSGSVCF